ncbi:MAG TPA: hypothetical protein VGG54_20965, partial [Trebonia sp.]
MMATRDRAYPHVYRWASALGRVYRSWEAYQVWTAEIAITWAMPRRASTGIKPAVFAALGDGRRGWGEKESGRLG